MKTEDKIKFGVLLGLVAVAWIAFDDSPGTSAEPVSGQGPMFVFDEPIAKLELPPALSNPNPPEDQFTYEVKAVGMNDKGQAVTNTATGVAIGPETILTVYHLCDGSTRANVFYPIRTAHYSVKIDGSWCDATFQPVAGADVHSMDMAYLTIKGADLPHVSLKHPDYGDRVKVFAGRSGSMMSGTVTQEHRVSLSHNEPGVKPGDSGSPIYSDQGQLVGIAVGYEDGEPRSVVMMPVQAYKESVSTSPVQTQPNCPDGQCNKQPQYITPRRGIFGRLK